MVEQQIAALSEDIRTIDQRSAHGIIEIEQAYNDRLTAVEARVSSVHSSLVVPTFDTKVTEYLCSGWVFFFLQTNFDFLTSHF